MTSRQQRRAAERAARKLALKQAKQQPQQEQQPQPQPPAPESTPSISQARLTANQANAQHSTGPRTQAGRAKSSRNSFKHGLYSKCLIVEGEDPAQLDALRADLFAEHQPQTETEALLVNEMADQYWRLRRARLMEAFFLNDDPINANLNSVHRVMTGAERGFHKALKTLTDLQKQRGFVPQNDSVEAPSEGTAGSESGSVPLNNPPESTTPPDFCPPHGRTEEDSLEMEQEFAATERSLRAA